MRRMDGLVEFDREWNDYKFGFGSPTGEFWSGYYDFYILFYLISNLIICKLI